HVQLAPPLPDRTRFRSSGSKATLPRRNGPFLREGPCGGRESGALLATGCEPRFARFAVRTPVRTPHPPIHSTRPRPSSAGFSFLDRKSTRLNSSHVITS